MNKNYNQLSDNGRKRTSNLNWDDAKIFLAIAREGTLSGASKALKIGIATASRRLERLESALGVRLFTRDQLGYKLTDEGVTLLPQAEALESAGYAFSSAAQGNDITVSGHVRLATAQGLADNLIVPALPKLIEAHPNLTLEINTSVSTVNLHRRDADMALRMVRPERGNISIRKLGELGFGVYASKDYLVLSSEKEHDGSLEHYSFIGWSETQQHLPAARWLESTLRGKPCKLITSNMSAQISAVEAGIGVAVLPHYIAQQKGLVCVQSNIGCDQPVWLAIHSDLSYSRRIRTVAEFLTSLVLENKDALAKGVSIF
ncbi:LysR family transcriptional regulator [Vibrio hannami]|uniref:LysR family transcriptional regulator n=1 Tax=Vibrio hannami TaxID=2717094 RepID=UPI00240FE5AE|nr:LysR family transcriptional regulator [Vibrio hannami]MDG3085371.1 LysR family transcriptional regulator [Vibrio hannami]